MSQNNYNKFIIQQALISVSNKNNLENICKALNNKNIQILSSGGTAKYIKNNSINTIEISKYTNQTEILGGRVKTLHPKIYGGILARDNNSSDHKDLDTHNINKINLIIVNLYPFQEEYKKEVKNNSAYNTIDNLPDNLIENIDIGGVTLIRAAAKNYKDNIIIVDPKDYDYITDKINNSDNNSINISLEERFKLASKAFKYTAEYENSINSAFELYSENSICSQKLPENINLSLTKTKELRYGENPEQEAAIYTITNDSDANLELLQGKALSYNNLVDSNSAINVINSLNVNSTLKNYSNCVIIKHATPCGIASDNNLISAYNKAFEADPKSAFGGIVAVNQNIDSALADKIISNQFVEVIIAPSIDPQALDIFKNKPNLRIIKFNYNKNLNILNNLEFKNISNNISNNFLIQTSITNEDLDNNNFKLVTENNNVLENHALLLDLKFAWSAVQNVKSNAIVIAKDLQTIGIGGGQTSRVGSVELAIKLAKEHGHKLNNSVLASDAFFPFPDSIEIAANYEIKAIIQPGGSKQDPGIISKANELGITMFFTNKRKFLH